MTESADLADARHERDLAMQARDNWREAHDEARRLLDEYQRHGNLSDAEMTEYELKAELREAREERDTALRAMNEVILPERQRLREALETVARLNFESVDIERVINAALTPTKEPATCPTCGSGDRARRLTEVRRTSPTVAEAFNCTAAWHGEEPTDE